MGGEVDAGNTLRRHPLVHTSADDALHANIKKQLGIRYMLLDLVSGFLSACIKSKNNICIKGLS